MSKLNTLDRVQKVRPAGYRDASDRQNLADTATAPERRGISLPPPESPRYEAQVTLSATPFPAQLSDPGRLGQTGWFQQSLIAVAPPSRGAPLTTFLLMAGGTFVFVGGIVWLFSN